MVEPALVEPVETRPLDELRLVEPRLVEPVETPPAGQTRPLNEPRLVEPVETRPAGQTRPLDEPRLVEPVETSPLVEPALVEPRLVEPVETRPLVEPALVEPVETRPAGQTRPLDVAAFATPRCLPAGSDVSGGQRRWERPPVQPGAPAHSVRLTPWTMTGAPPRSDHRGFAGDSYSGIHPEVLAAIAAADIQFPGIFGARYQLSSASGRMLDGPRSRSNTYEHDECPHGRIARVCKASLVEVVMRKGIATIALLLCLACTTDGTNPPQPSSSVAPTPDAQATAAPTLPEIAEPEPLSPKELATRRRAAAVRSHLEALAKDPVTRTAALAKIYQYSGMPLIGRNGQVLSIAEVGSGLAISTDDIWFQAHAPRAARLRLVDLTELILNVTGIDPAHVNAVTAVLVEDIAKGRTSPNGPRRYLSEFITASQVDGPLAASSSVDYDTANLLLRTMADDVAMSAASDANAVRGRPRKHAGPRRDRNLAGQGSPRIRTYRSRLGAAPGSPCSLTDSENLILRTAGEIVTRALRGQDWVPIPTTGDGWTSGPRPRRLPGLLDFLNKSLGGGEESALEKWRKKSGHAQYLADAGRLLALLASLKAETTMIDKTELVRTQTTESAGERVVLNTRVWYDFGDLTWFNCFSHALASVGVRLVIPPNGALVGTDVNYVGAEGFPFQTGQGADVEDATVQFFTVPGGPRPDRQQTDEQGRARIGVEGRPQRVKLPKDAQEDRKRFGLRVWVALSADSMGQDLWDAFGTASKGTPQEVLVQGLLTLARRSSILVEQPRFTVVDWSAKRIFDFSLDYDRVLPVWGHKLHIKGVIVIDDAARARGDRGITEVLKGYTSATNRGKDCSRVKFTATMPSATVSDDGRTLQKVSFAFSNSAPSVCSDGFRSSSWQYPGAPLLRANLPAKPGESIESPCYYTCVITLTRR